MTKARKTEREDALTKLRKWIKPGDTVYTVLDHVSASGMSRAIRVVLLSCHEGKVADLHPNFAIGTLLGLRHWTRNGQTREALVVSGGGTDMGYHIVYTLSRLLFPEFTCIGKDCPSNDHHNGDRDFTIGKHHSDGGYALRHRWL